MNIFRIFVIVAGLLAGSAWADTAPVGTVKTVSGDAFIVAAGKQVRATLGAAVYLGNQIKTGPKSSLGIVFNDATVTSFGSDTELTIDEYLFQPSQDKQKFSAKLLKGSMNYLSGAIAKLHPESVSIKTPTGTLGVRGTQLLALVEGFRSYVTLIADPDGRVGRVLIQGDRGSQIIDIANYSAPLDGSSPPSATGSSTIQADFGDAIGARPVQPALPMPGSGGLGGSVFDGSAGAGAQASSAAAIGGLSTPGLTLGAVVLGLGIAASQGPSGTTGTTGTQ